jgi:hypothetical protein
MNKYCFVLRPFHMFVFNILSPLSNGLLRRTLMLETLAIVLIILWIMGLVSSYTLGGFIHVLLVVAIIVILLRVIQGRSV